MIDLPLSIFGSKMNSRKAVVVLLTLLAVLLGGVELVTRFGVNRISRDGQRWDKSWREAVRLRPTADGGAKTVLLVGNSLLDQGLSDEGLGRVQQPGIAMYKIIALNTTLLDWRYAVARLIREGSRPSVLIIAFAPSQLSGKSLNLPSFAWSMLDWPDVRRASIEAGLDRTAAAEMFFAKASAWLGYRAGARNVVTQKVFPGARELTLAFLPPGVSGDESQHLPAALARAEAVAAQTESAGVSLQLILMPVPSSRDGAWRKDLLASLREAGVPVLDVHQCESFGPRDYSDGFHLNAEGAQKFEQVLGSAVQNGWVLDGKGSNLPAGCFH
jgi:hypothetical protein